ncbi:MAG: PAS domain S-box protein [Deltaproteobacteria bacterium]|nr:PAS domain S-box protein [Deltaproteobacteria bacterium]
MDPKPLRRNLFGGTYLTVVIAAVVLVVCLATLLGKTYRAQIEIRASILNNFKQDLAKHAAALSYFYTERKNDLKNLPTKREISIFFENRALGMSMEYGLRASFIAIQESFNQVLNERMLGRDQIYTRFVFVDSSGECLIDTQRTPNTEAPPKTCKEFLTPSNSHPAILVSRVNGKAQLIASCPYFFKGTYAGQIVAWISTETVHKHLIGADSQFHKKIVRVFSSQGDFYLPAERNGAEVSAALPIVTNLADLEFYRFKMVNPTGGQVEMISTWMPIQDTPLLLVGAIPAQELFGYLSPWHLLAVLGSLSLFSLLGGGVAWWTNTRNVVLRTRLEGAAIREQEIGEKNLQLEEEIAERRRAEAALRSAEEKYRAIFENAVEGIFQSTPDGHFLSVNPAMAKMHGFASPEDMLTEVTDIRQQLYVDPKRRDDRQRLMTDHGFVKGFECQVYKKGGGKLWVSQSARAVPDDQGHTLYYEGFVQDITEGKEAEELSRNLIAASPIGIYINQAGQFQIINQWLQEITGFDKEELYLMDPANLVHPEDRREVEQKAASMLEGKSSTAYEYRIITREGKVRWIMETVTPTTYQGNEAILGFSMDITGHKELEKQLLQAQKMEAVGRLAGGVAHDFNNMLGAIIGYTEMLMKSLNPDEPPYHYGEEVKKAADRAAMLTRQLLAFSRKQMLQPQKLNLNSIIGDLEKMLRRLIGEDVELYLNLEPVLAIIKADAGQMEQVMLNLAINARDAMPQGGRLIISTANVNLDNTYVRKQADFVPGPYILMGVTDDGQGMDPETVDHIFEPFFTTKDVGSGTGLGLSTVYGIVKQSGGFIEVSSQPGLGTTFKVYLPAVGDFVEFFEAKAAEEEPLCGSETILLVEDEEILRKLVKNALEINGYKVLEARNGREAITICEQYREPIQLMLTDVVMPQMSGRELAQSLKEMWPEIRVLYMSGYAEDVLFRQGVLDTSLTFLQKPFRQYELTVKVRQVLDAAQTA